MSINKPESISDMTFSTTDVLYIDQDADLQVRIRNLGNGTILLQHVHVLIKKMD